MVVHLAALLSKGGKSCSDGVQLFFCNVRLILDEVDEQTETQTNLSNTQLKVNT